MQTKIFALLKKNKRLNQSTNLPLNMNTLISFVLIFILPLCYGFGSNDFVNIPYVNTKPLEVLVANQTEGTAQLVKVSFKFVKKKCL